MQVSGRGERFALSAAFSLAAAFIGASAAPAYDFTYDPWADDVVSYVEGIGANPSYLDPTTTLGEPERFTGEGIWPSAVTIFNPAFGTDELVSIGDGGSLTVKFDEPITDDAGHLFGIDLIVFGNGTFEDERYPDGEIADPAGTLGVDAMDVWVSADNVVWVSLGEFAEGFFPAQGYLDTLAQSTIPGTIPTSFQKPVDPSLTLSDFDGLTYAEALTLYDGSGGGTPIDIGPSGLSSVQYVRIENITPGTTVEIEAFAVVPEPSTSLLACMLAGIALRRKH